MSREFGRGDARGELGGWDADSEQVRNYLDIPLLLHIDIHLLVLDSQSQQGRLLFPTCPPTPTLILGIPIPHPCSTAHCTFYSARAHPHFHSFTAALHVHHSPTDTPPDADLWRCRYFCSLNLAALPSYSSHGPCTAPLTAVPARMCTASTNTGHRPVLDLGFPRAFAVRRSCIMRAAELALLPPALHCALHVHHPTSVLRASHASPPHPSSLHPRRSI
ncbi:hypothetical protein B0H13DRAFT_2317756 [Mycena leptocephala]|nr:hypothetical protein B0H13DRAFT_2317756 [Mycena leptocephala]